MKTSPTLSVGPILMKPGNLPPIYLDYNATAPVLPAALERMQQVLADVPGNASSPHAFGQAARSVLEESREILAGHLGFSRREITFTSGGSESNTALLRGLMEAGATGDGSGDGIDKANGAANGAATASVIASASTAESPNPPHMITSTIEHPSVLATCRWLESRGFAVDRLPVNSDGVVRVEKLAELIRPETRLVSVMAANNETGVIQPLAEVVRTVRLAQENLGVGRKIIVHTDAVQAFGRIPLPLAEWGVDAATVVAHKLGGPKGIGLLATRKGATVPGLVLGGNQERGHRAGTESVFLAAGFAAAVDWVFQHFTEMNARVESLRNRLVEGLSAEPGFFLNGADAPRLPNTANLGFEGLSAESLLVALDLRGIAISTGSACSSGAIEPSHVLQAMGVPARRLLSALRVSLGHATTGEETDRVLEAFRAESRRLRG